MLSVFIWEGLDFGGVNELRIEKKLTSPHSILNVLQGLPE